MIIDGKELSQKLLLELSKRVHALKMNYDVIPHLAVLRLGDDPAISSYIAQKEKMAKQIGAYVSVYNYPVSSTEKQLKEAIDFLQTKGDIHGIIIQLPLPPHLKEKQLIKEVKPELDVDGFREQSPFIVPLAAAVFYVLETVFEKTTKRTEYDFLSWLQKQQIVVMGKGTTGGAPIITLLRKLHLHPLIVDSQTLNSEEITKNADIIISAVGKRGVLSKEMIKKDAILIGIGMGKDSEGNFFGDYNEEEIKEKASYYTPIPGGIGPVNVAKLMENLVIAAENSVK